MNPATALPTQAVAALLWVSSRSPVWLSPRGVCIGLTSRDPAGTQCGPAAGYSPTLLPIRRSSDSG